MNEIIILIFIIIIFYILYNFVNESRHVFPKKLFICYKTKKIPNYVIENLQKLNPDYEIYFYDNEDCESFLLNEYGEEYLEIFRYIKDGPIKSDFWRVCVLYKYGGIYSDIDIEYKIPFDEFIENDVEFVSCISQYKKQFNPHLIVCKKGNHIMKKCIDEYLNKYRKKMDYTYWGWSIVIILNDILYSKVFSYELTLDGIYKGNDKNKYQFLKEIYDKKHYCIYKNQTILYNRYNDYSSEKHQFILN